MVAISVILSAVIAGFVMGLPVHVQKPWQVGVSLSIKEMPGDEIAVTIYGGDDFDRLESLMGSIDGDLGACTILSASSTPALEVGAEMRCTGVTPSSTDHVVVIGHFNDGSEQVLIDTFV
jgi:hypothetical protein